MVCAKNVWGPATWTVLHCAAESAATAPDGDTLTQEARGGAESLVRAVAKTLPCPVCRKHFAELLSRSETLHGTLLWSSKSTLRGFLIDAHNDVNKRTGKPSVDHADVPRILNAGKTAPSTRVWVGAVVAIAIVLVLAALLGLAIT